jgi:hypothetical protein
LHVLSGNSSLDIEGAVLTKQKTVGMGTRLCGIAIATCCHSKCGWIDCAAREFLQNEAGFSEQEFDLLRKWAGYVAVPEPSSAMGESALSSVDPIGSIVAATSAPLAQRTGIVAAVNGDIDTQSTASVGSSDGIFNNRAAEASRRPDGSGVATSKGSSQTPKKVTPLADAASITCDDNKPSKRSPQERAALGRMCKRLIDHGRIQFIKKYLNMEVCALILVLL